MQRFGSMGLLVVIVVTVGLLLASGHKVKAQGSNLKAEGWHHLFGDLNDRTPHARDAWKNSGVVPFRIDQGSILITDLDGSGTVTTGDIFVANGTISTPSGVVGDWQGAGTFIDSGSVATIQFRFNGAGAIVVSGGSAYPDGLKSGTPSRAIVGGTGKFANASGNAGLASDGSSYFIGFGVK